MESKQIKDSAIRTGVGAVASGKEGYYARLHNDKAWCIPNIIGYIGSGEFKGNIYIEVTFSGRYKVSAMALQGERQYSYGEFVRISYEYNGQFYYHKIGSTEQVRFFFLSHYLGNNQKSFIKETKESVYIVTCQNALFSAAIAVLEFVRFPSSKRTEHTSKITFNTIRHTTDIEPA